MKDNPVHRILAIDDSLARLLAIMATLRGPQGCPWDKKQTFHSLKAYLLEETYELVDAIDSGDPKEHCGELGDLLLQIVFQSQIAAESGRFDFHDVAQGIADKLIRRHPHIFADARADTPEEVVETWEKVKEAEGGGLLDGVPNAMPALQKSDHLCKKAARVGFDWPDMSGVLDKVKEEATELANAATTEEKEHEMGDLLFAVANLARKMNIDPEQALQKANNRFRNRFSHVEKRLSEQGKSLQESTLEQMDALWDEAKKGEHS